MKGLYNPNRVAKSICDDILKSYFKNMIQISF